MPAPQDFLSMEEAERLREIEAHLIALSGKRKALNTEKARLKARGVNRREAAYCAGQYPRPSREARA